LASARDGILGGILAMDSPLSLRLQTALALHRANHHQAAEKEYLGLLRDDPRQPDAAHLLGILYLQTGRHAEAIALFKTAIAARPTFAEAFVNLGTTWLALGNPAEAVHAFESAARLKPQLVEAHSNLGNALRMLGRIQDALNACRHAATLNPRHVGAHNNLGLALSAAGNSTEAIQAFQTALACQPEHVDAMRNLAAELRGLERLDEAENYLQRILALRPDEPRSLALLGEIHHQRGQLEQAEQLLQKAVAASMPPSPSTLVELANVLCELDRPREALAYYDRAIECRPDFTEALFNQASALRDLGRFSEAIELARRALSHVPDSPKGLANLATLLREVCQAEEAVALCQRAIELQPEFAEAWNCLGASRHELGEFDAGLAACEEALRCGPTLHSARLNRGIFRLSRAEFREGWEDYEFRLKQKYWRRRQRQATRPRWDGSPLNGRRILLLAEQGFGDSFQFIRYARLLRAAGARVFMAAPRPLVGILASCPDVEQCVAWNDPWPDHDVYLELLSVGKFLIHSLEDIPAPIPYLSAKAELVDDWRQRLESHPGFRVVIAWQGSLGEQDYRRVPVSHFSALARIPGVQLVSVQMDGSKELAAHRDTVPALDLGDCIDREHGAFQDTAAVLMNADLVVASDTSIPHLAGALDRPVWLALRSPSEWRWLLDRDDTPWYPRMRLFRQSQRGDWTSVFQRMADELSAIVSRRTEFDRQF
jgi:tetratricopeptide (TPR) repeat protein